MTLDPVLAPLLCLLVLALLLRLPATRRLLATGLGWALFGVGYVIAKGRKGLLWAWAAMAIGYYRGKGQ